MREILCSTGAIIGRPNGRNYRLLEDLAKQLQCDGFELMMYDTWYEEVEELTAYVQGLNLSIPVVHCEKKIGESISKGGPENFSEAFRLFEINCKLAKDIGAGKMVLHLWDGVTSDANFSNNMEAYPKLAEMASEYGLDLLVENVVCNQETPMDHLSQLAKAYPDIHFVFDTKMAAFHSQLELLYEEEYDWLWKKGHIRHYHVNDYAGGHKDWANLKTLPMGKGKIDFDSFFEHVKKTGYDGTFTVESTAFNAEGVVDVQMLNDQFGQIRRYVSG